MLLVWIIFRTFASENSLVASFGVHRFLIMKDRIKLIMEQQGCNQVAFAQMIGIAPATLSGIFNGRTQPTLATASAIHECFPEISLNWLMFGEGEMKVSSTSDNTLARADARLQGVDDAGGFGDLFSQMSAQPSGPSSQGARSKMHSQAQEQVKNVDKKERRISEIRVFFDDGTYEIYQTFKS